MSRLPGNEDAGWRPTASRHALEARAQLLASIRCFFAERKVLEVETAILSSAANTDPNINSLRTDSIAARYLRTSPEFPMKRLLATGMPDIYEMGRVFRAGESGPWHNPEFTLLEWYHAGWKYLDLANEVIELVRNCAKGRFDHWQVEHRTYRELFLQHTGLDPFHCDESECAAHALERGIRTGPLDRQQWLDLLISHVIQPALDSETLTVLYDFPPQQAALARIRVDPDPVAERFEIYVGQAELANGYQELTDPEEQLRRFEHDIRTRHLHGEETGPLDHRLIAALRHGMPECAGVALGVDRLLMALLELDGINAVLAFPAERA